MVSADTLNVLICIKGRISMLVRVAVENYRSIKERQVLSMVAGTHRRHPSHFVYCNDVKLLKGGYIFGANAAGKTTLIRAMAFVRTLVVKGLSFKELNNQQFRIDPDMLNYPGVFQFDIFTNGHFYSYGVAVNYKNCRIEGEWLYLCDKGDIAVFERSFDNDETVIETDMKFSDKKNEQIFEVLSDTVGDDMLFLREIVQRKMADNQDFEAYYDIYKWFSRLTVIYPNSQYQSRTDVSDSRVMAHLLSQFDTGIEGIFGKEEPIEKVLSFLDDELRNEIIGDLKSGIAERKNSEKKDKVQLRMNFGDRQFEFSEKDGMLVGKKIKMNHGNPDDLFDFYDESDGTQRLIDLLPVFEAGKENHVIVVDELDRSFHTKLLQYYIEHFYQTTQGAMSQLIATVHDSNIMDLDILRQDEIWFIERQKDHSSKLYSLNQFKIRYDKKAAKDYLIGRYGAIPSINQIRDVEDTETEE